MITSFYCILYAQLVFSIFTCNYKQITRICNWTKLITLCAPTPALIRSC